ncbi:MAG: hypothetical protein HOM14_10235 [Gammaproteobacteria bacterium]|jgi:hypothetical protein|nr:hypothetical protein [Gammaproteobacteria bacterium]MBT4196846.1 hypothetical protein [Gammaproteobacteria bacterium]MBT4450018.1 hypothetical protein [Gammaproteobacteria bacterium]MBT4861902.1 hypothetical protein [Gammaproteobacteria bacterium]MBT6551720.1 hypothetical protein [Gammaproteobacteria bacterium]
MSLDLSILKEIIKSGNPLEHIAVDQLSDQLIMVNEFNLSSRGEYLEDSSEEGNIIQNGLNNLINREYLILRNHPLKSLDNFCSKSMIARL